MVFGRFSFLGHRGNVFRFSHGEVEKDQLLSKK
jgi:hypothetical protein